MFILQYKLIDVTGSSKNDITILQRTRGRIEEKETKNCTVLYSLQYRHSCKVADEMTLLGVGNKPIHEEEEMTIGDCGGRREDSDSAETINSSNGDNGTLDMDEEQKKKEL